MMDHTQPLDLEEFYKRAYEETGLPDEQKPVLLNYIFGKQYSQDLKEPPRFYKETIVRIEAERLERLSKAKPKPLPAKAQVLLANAKQALAEKRYDEAVQMLLAEPVVFCGEALYLIGNCLESGEGVPGGDLDFAHLYWASAVQASFPFSPADSWHLDVLSKIVKRGDPSWKTNPKSFPKCLSNGVSWFQNLWKKLKTESNQASSLTLDKKSVLARGAELPQVTAESVSNPPPPPITPSAEPNLELTRLVLEEEERRLWEALQSRPRELRGLGEPELAQAKNLLEQGPNEENEKLAMELLRRKPALWHPEALHLVACCVSAGRGVRKSDREIAFLYYTFALKLAELGAKQRFFYLDSLWHVVEYLEETDAAKISLTIFRINIDPGFYFKQLVCLMNGLNPQHRRQLLDRSRQAPATSLLSKLAWREMWPTQGELSTSIRPMQLSVRMQRFALSIKGKEMLKLEDYQNEIKAFFCLAPTKHFWLDLRDVLAHWWPARTDALVAVRSCALREILVGQSVAVEYTQLIKLRQLPQEYRRQQQQQHGLELVPPEWAMRYRRKPSIFKFWEQDCTRPVDANRLQRFLMPSPAPTTTTATGAVPPVPEWLAGAIHSCFEERDGDLFVRWLARQFRAFQDLRLQDPSSQKRPSQSWLCLQGRVTPWLKQLLRSFCLALGDQHVVVLRNVKVEPHKLVEMQQRLLVVIDGCNRRGKSGEELRDLLQMLCSDLKIPGYGWGDICLPNRSQVLVLPNDDGESLWTASQLQGLGVAATSLRLKEAVRDSNEEQLQGAPSPLETGLFLQKVEVPDDNVPEAKVGHAYKRFSLQFRRRVALKRKLPCKKRRPNNRVPHVYVLKQGPNKGKFVIRLQDLVASFESFLGLAKNELNKSAREQFLACFKQEFTRINLEKPFAQNMYSSLGKNGPKKQGLLFPYAKKELLSLLSPKREREGKEEWRKAKRQRRQEAH